MRISAVSPNLYTTNKQPDTKLQNTAVKSSSEQNHAPKFGAAHALAPLGFPMAMAAYTIPAFFTPIARAQEVPDFLAGVPSENIIRGDFKVTPFDDVSGLTKEEKRKLKSQYDNVNVLLRLIESGSREKFQEKVLEIGADSSLQNQDGKTALMGVAEVGDNHLARFLLEQNVDINIKDKDGRNAYRYAKDHNRNTIVNLLKVAHKKQGDQLIQYSQDGKLDEFEAMLKTGVDPQYAFANSKHLLEVLRKANPENQKRLLELLVEHKANINRRDRDGMTPLLHTAQDGDLSIAELLLDHHAHLKAKNDDDDSALTLSAKKRHNGLAKLFISKGINVNHADKNGITSLMHASEHGNIELLDMLISNEANVNLIAKDSETALCKAVGKEQLRAVLKLLDARAKTEHGNMFPLWKAVQMGKPVLVSTLLRHGANPEVYSEHNNSHLLHEILLSKHDTSIKRQIVQTLIEQGAYVEAKDDKGRTPLMLASGNGELESVRLLLARYGKSANTMDKNGHTSLIYAIKGNHLSTAKLLLEHKADPNLAGKEALLPLIDAIKKGNLQGARLLLDHGANPNESRKDTKSEMTPLSYAAEFGDIEMVRELLKRGAEVDRLNQKRSTALTLAAYNGHEEVARLLMNAGANPDHVDSTGWIFGSRPKDYAKRNKNPKLDALLTISPKDRQTQSENLLRAVSQRRFKEAQRLLSQGAYSSYTSPEGVFPLEQAILNNDVQMVKLLINRLANLSQTIKGGGTVLHAAALGGKKEIVELLVKNGINVNAPDAKGNTALFYAAEKGNTDIINILLDNGALINQPNKEGVTPYMTAGKGSHLKAVELLMLRGADICKRDKNGWFFGNTGADWAKMSNNKVVRERVKQEQVKQGC